MSKAWITAPLAAAATACLSFAANAQNSSARIAPESPLQFERVHLRVTVDDCVFDKTSVSVELQGRTLRAHYRPRTCIAPGATEVVDIQLGALPAGDYVAELVDDTGATATQPLPFRVEAVARTLQNPPTPFPLADYSGLWSPADESGWGLSLQQGATDRLFGELLVFDRDSDPRWFTLQAGKWLSATHWSGFLVASRGNYWATPDYAPSSASYTIVGTVGIDFHMSPGLEDAAVLTYMLDGEVMSKALTRSRL